jgi:plasmid stabilization system protein ParE
VLQLRISAEAETDLDEMIAFTIATWSREQAETFLSKLEHAFNLLAKKNRTWPPLRSNSLGLAAVRDRTARRFLYLRRRRDPYRQSP